MSQTLFGNLAYSLSTSPENLATEALNFILNRSHIAREAFIRFLSQAHANLPDDLRFQTQESGSDGARPDLVGLDSYNRQIIITEAKFWAGLTDNQPGTYLRRLIECSGAILVFIAPARRFATLWPELERRSAIAGFAPRQTVSLAKEFVMTPLAEGPILALASWRAILHAIRQSLETEGDLDAASDVIQLAGLCERMDEQAFLPLLSEELTSSHGTRITQYCSLVNELTEVLVAEGIASIQGLKATATETKYGRYMIIHGYGCMLQLSTRLWATRRETPLWLGIKDSHTRPWSFPTGAKARLAHLENEEPTRLLREEGGLFVPLFLPTGVERDEVVKDLLRQLREDIIRYLAPVG